MKTGLLSLFLLYLLLVSGFALGKEPTNLAAVKQDLMRYQRSGEYEQAINAIDTAALNYLKYRLNHPTTLGKKPAIVLDIDETSLSNYTHMARLDFGGSQEEIRHSLDEGTDTAIRPTLKLYRYAKAAHIAIFFITGRDVCESKATIRNLQQVGYTAANGLFFRPSHYHRSSITPFKTAVRKQISAAGYDILLNIGDQESDLKGGYADKTFKLPNPYYFIP